jgi:serine protease Do
MVGWWLMRQRVCVQVSQGLRGQRDRSGPTVSVASGPPISAGAAPRPTLAKAATVALAAALALGMARPTAAGFQVIGVTEVPRIVARALPAVVSITARRIERDQFNKSVPKAGLGSGVILDRHGHILTNNHVVEGFEEFKVTLPDGRTFRGMLVGTDFFTDLAVLKIEGKDLRHLQLGDSSRLAIGETVIAIGSPLWIEGGPTVTVGVISGKRRSMEEADEPDQPMLHDLLQTDAAINPGNSGGPLLNLKGEVVGINTATMPSAHGIGFAIPINNAKPVVKTLLAHGRLVRPSMGVTAVSVTPQLAFTNDLQVESGALVVRVDKDGPAAAVGMQPDDIIIAVGGAVVEDLHHFHELLFRRTPGEAVQVTVWRNGETLTLSPVLVQDR